MLKAGFSLDEISIIRNIPENNLCFIVNNRKKLSTTIQETLNIISNNNLYNILDISKKRKLSDGKITNMVAHIKTAHPVR